jgi:hypothetical protein
MFCAQRYALPVESFSRNLPIAWRLDGIVLLPGQEKQRGSKVTVAPGDVSSYRMVTIS